MRKTAILGAAAALMLATPATAQTGFVGVSYSNNDLQSGSTDVTIDGYRLGGEAAFDAGGLGAQVGASIAGLDANSTDVTVWGLDGHLFQRTGQWLWGGTLGYRDAEVDGGSDGSAWLAVFQTHYEMEQTTLVGALSYSDFEAGPDQGNTIGVDGEFRFFANENLRFDATLGWRDIDFDGGGDSSDWHGGVGGEFQFVESPFSIFAFYMHTDNEDADLTMDVLAAGVRMNWGGTLFTRDRSGATMMRPGDGLSASGL
jgi:hypothetical protein